MCGCLNIATLVGNKVGKAIERNPYVLYSLIGKIPIGGQSMEGGGGLSSMRKKCLISSSSFL